MGQRFTVLVASTIGLHSQLALTRAAEVMREGTQKGGMAMPQLVLSCGHLYSSSIGVQR